MRVSGFAVLVLALAFASRLAPSQIWVDDERETFRWRGRVDGVDDIVIIGNEVRIDHVAANPIQQQDHRFTAPLPAADVEVTLEVIEGRGRVRIIEQPTGRNDHAAVVRVDDGEQSGDADYEFELSWPSRPWGGSTSHDAVFRWRGRVDVGCQIEIHGGEHIVKDQGGQGTQELDFYFSEALPSTDLPVSLDKREGRGDVVLVQTPSWSNDFTAIVQIEDSKGGADDYELELRWPRQ